jgi:alpha-beta hydrolase superfamily lysophospholipase
VKLVSKSSFFYVSSSISNLGSGINSRKIMIVGHSVGGIVARTAPLLDNHPTGCIVSDIVQLSSPNLRYVYYPYTWYNIVKALNVTRGKVLVEIYCCCQNKYRPRIHLNVKFSSILLEL